MIFNSRETYLVAVSSWKEQYKELSINIRKLKAEHKKLQQENKYTYSDFLTMASLVNDANELLAERAAGKKEAYVQYLASRVQI